MHYESQDFDLFEIPAAPGADDEVQSESHKFRELELAIHRFGH